MPLELFAIVSFFYTLLVKTVKISHKLITKRLMRKQLSQDQENIQFLNSLIKNL